VRAEDWGRRPEFTIHRSGSRYHNAVYHSSVL
jgi:hypothetical protein